MKTLLTGLFAFVLMSLALPVCGQSSAVTASSVAMLTTSYPGTTGAGSLPRAKVQSLVGRWKGQLAIPGNMLSMSLEITQQAGQTTAVLETPATALNHHSMLFTQRHDTLRFYDPVAQASFTATQTIDGSQLVGHWQQLGFTEEIILRYEAPAAPIRTTHTTKWSTGTLENGRPVGIWQYFRPNGKGQPQLTQLYDHSSGQLLLGSTDSLRYNVELIPGQWDTAVLTQSPWFIGGIEALTPYTSKLQYPAAAQQRHIEGVVTVGFTIDSLGRATDFTVTRSLGSGCDEEALRVARTIPNTWTPARIGTQAVVVRHSIRFNFRLR